MTQRKETSEEIAARVRETLPPYLRQSPEDIEADKRAQKLRAASFTRSKLTEGERLITRGKQLEEIARTNLETQNELREEGHNVSTRGGANLEMVEQENIRLAHALELQGRYAEAAGVHPYKREQVRLLKIEEAISKPDDEHCRCPATKAKLNEEEIEVHPHYEVKKIYSRSHGKIVSLVGCTKCPSLNATPDPPEQLAKSLHAHAASAGAKKAVGSDASLLKVKK